jgi:hypothetical protein
MQETDIKKKANEALLWPMVMIGIWAAVRIYFDGFTFEAIEPVSAAAIGAFLVWYGVRR